MSIITLRLILPTWSNRDLNTVNENENETVTKTRLNAAQCPSNLASNYHKVTVRDLVWVPQVGNENENESMTKTRR